MALEIYIINGPNLNLLGKRQPHIYGRETLTDVEAECVRVAGEHGLRIRFLQSNAEFEIINWAVRASGSLRISRVVLTGADEPHHALMRQRRRDA